MEKKSKPKTWEQLKQDPRVSYADIEIDDGERQYWVGLKDGWRVRGDAANHTIHETSVGAVLSQFNPEPCDCSDACRAAGAKAEGR